MVIIRTRAGPVPSPQSDPETPATRRPGVTQPVASNPRTEPPSASLTGRANADLRPAGLAEPKTRNGQRPSWVDRYNAFVEAVNAAPPRKHGRLARQFVRSLSPEEQAAIPLVVENNLIEILLASHVIDPNIETIHTLYSVATSDSASDAITARLARGLADRLNRDPLVKRTFLNWTSMNEGERLEAMQRVADLSAAAFGFESAPIATYSQHRRRRAVPSGRVSGGEIAINTHPEVLGSFAEAINTIVHESCHVYQGGLIGAFKAKIIVEGDLRYEEARAFDQNLRLYSDGEEPGDGDVDAYTVYRHQPLEAHAWSMAQLVVEALDTGPPPEESR